MAEVQFGEVIVTEEQEKLMKDRARRFNSNASQREEMSEENLRRLPPVSLPYAQLEACFNHKNLWIPRHHTDPARITYNFDEPREDGKSRGEWDAFIDAMLRSLDLPQPFYQPKRLAAKPPADRLRVLEHQIQASPHTPPMG